MKIVISLPALNEAATIGGVLESLPRQIEGADSVEYLVVDDGSTDATADAALSQGARVVSHGRNLGLGQAFHTAVGEALGAGGHVLVTIDADGQFDASEIPLLVEPILEGRAEVVTGSRFHEGQRPPGMPRMKFWGNRFFAWLVNTLLGEHLRDVSCGFRAYSRDALMNLNLIGKHTYTQESLLDLLHKGMRVVEVPISVRYWPERESRVAGSLVVYGVNALKIILRTARDFKPLRFFGVIAGAVILLGVVMDLWLLSYWLESGEFSPYKFVGFTGTGLVVVGLLILGFALLADMLDRLRINQERVLYQQRKMMFGPNEGASGEPTKP
jgi:glycosyltransferase involved in cell wall biosynthesis